MNDLTAADEVLLAAAKLTDFTTKEFTEWQLTRETWLLNKNRWGLRGWEQEHPDHKRVMNEVMAKGTQKIVGKGWFERTKPNYYRLTQAGLAKAESLRFSNINSKARSLHEYEAIAPYVKSKIFEDYCKDQNEPRTWLGAAAFLKLKNYEPNVLETTLYNIKNSIESALKWIEDNNENVLRRDDSSKLITREQLLKLKEFLSILEQRFKSQFDAIRSKRK